MSRFSVGIVKWGRDPHVRCFEDFARATASALRSLGHEVVPTFDQKPGRLIMFGAGGMTDPENALPEDAIIFNAEQVAAVADPRFYVLETYKKHVVWDYSAANASALRRAGFERVVHCPIGYVPSMSTIEQAEVQDIDVLFGGSVNARRREVLDALDQTDLKVARLFGVYGEQRDAFIARSKIVLNLHFFEHSIFEIFRVSHLLANRKCVVSEANKLTVGDLDLNLFSRRSTWVAERRDIVETCQILASARGVESRRELEEHGFRQFSKIDLVENVRCALAESGS